MNKFLRVLFLVLISPILLTIGFGAGLVAAIWTVIDFSYIFIMHSRIPLLKEVEPWSLIIK
jgi:hypothetical protein